MTQGTDMWEKTRKNMEKVNRDPITKERGKEGREKSLLPSGRVDDN